MTMVVFLNMLFIKEFKSGTSIHALQRIGNTNKFLVFVNDNKASIAMALQYPDIRIEPLFDGISAYNPKATSIQIIKPAEMELRNGSFILVERGKIDCDNKGIEKYNNA